MKSPLLKISLLAFASLGIVHVAAQTSEGKALPSVTLPSVLGAPPLPGDPSSARSTLVKVSLGVSVVKPSSALYSQLPLLPESSGFLLKTVTPKGTADEAGLKPMDLIWKLGDQLLINEAQMMVLLSHHRPGGKLKISYFRSGGAYEAELTLQPRTSASPHPDVLAMRTPLPPALPMRVISYEDRSASISDKTGTATLTYREGKPWLHVESAQGVETFNDFVSDQSEVALVPALWRSRLAVLKRSLEESVRMRRLPRVRHVPRTVPKQRVVGGE